MKPATIVVFGLLLCAILHFVSATTEAAQDIIKPKGDTEYGVELGSGGCSHGCCNKSRVFRGCRVCCASAEEAKVFAQLMKDGMGRRGGATAAAGEDKAQVNGN